MTATLWIGTLQNGVFHHRAGELEELLPALPDPQVLSLAVSQDTAYVGTPLGVVEFRDGTRLRILADGFFARALAVHGDTLHVGTEDEGILDVPLQSRHTPPVGLDANSPPFPVLRLADIEGQIYAVSEAAVYMRDPGSKRWRSVLTAGAGLMADRDVAALALSAGRLWIGYFDRGLDVVDASLERAIHHEDDTLFCINRIVADPEHSRTAVATANGLVLFDSGGQPRQIMGRKDGFLADHITDVAFREGGMVVATPAGLSFADRSGVRSLYVFHGLVNNHVYTVATHGAQTLAGTLGGLSVLDDDAVRVSYTTANSRLKHNWITALVRVGDDWFVGTYGAGVLRLDSSGDWHSFPDLKPDFVVNPNAMIPVGGQVLAGTLDRGLFVFDRASGRWSNTIIGLPSERMSPPWQPRTVMFMREPATVWCASRRAPCDETPGAFCSLLASCVSADTGVLIPGDRQQPDPAVFSLNELSLDIRIDNGVARRSGSGRSSGITTGRCMKASTSSRFPAKLRCRTSPSGTRLRAFRESSWSAAARGENLWPSRENSRPSIQDCSKWESAQPTNPAVPPGPARKFTARIVPIPSFGTKTRRDGVSAPHTRRAIPVRVRGSSQARCLRTSASRISGQSLLSSTPPTRSRISRRCIEDLHPLRIRERTPNLIKADFFAYNVDLKEDFAVRYKLDPAEADTLRVITERESPNKDRDFSRLRRSWESRPAPRTRKRDPPRRERWCSYSTVRSPCNGTNWSEASRPVRQPCARLRPSETRFNLLLFNSDLNLFSPQPRLATTANIEAALTFVRNSRIRGGTSICNVP